MIFNYVRLSAIAFLLSTVVSSYYAADTPDTAAPASSQTALWTSRQPWSDPNFFPLAVWLQDPDNAKKYRAAGFNTYVGLWHGPTSEQLAQLKAAGVWAICEQKDVSLKQRDNSTIIGWMHGDEPDNAQKKEHGDGYGPPIMPEQVLSDYQQMHAADSSRPAFLNLSQGVGWDNWNGRGERSNHPEDYPGYLKGCDVGSFDIYPVNESNAEVAGKLWLVPFGVQRLKDWSGGKPVWNCLECGPIDGTRRPTPHQVRAEAWMSLIAGSKGLVYFVHQFAPHFYESSLFHDPEMLAAVTSLNHEIADLAPILNSPTTPGVVAVESENAQVPVSSLVKVYKNSIYIFTVGMRDGNATVSVKGSALSGIKVAEVIGENRTINVENGGFRDAFGSWDVHLYRLSSPAR